MRLTAIPLPNWPDDQRVRFGEPREAWVCFSGETELWWLRALKKGFRHCFAIARNQNHWLAIDPLSPHLEITILPVPPSFDLPHWLQQNGLTLMRAPIRRDLQNPAPFFIFSCVEVIKRFLGIHRRRIVTPHQLYAFLRQHNAFIPS
ncbi:MAG TPA: hypothetical protein VGF14_06725 [Alphaproteobacteria bacterium]